MSEYLECPKCGETNRNIVTPNGLFHLLLSDHEVDRLVMTKQPVEAAIGKEVYICPCKAGVAILDGEYAVKEGEKDDLHWTWYIKASR